MKRPKEIYKHNSISGYLHFILVFIFLFLTRAYVFSQRISRQEYIKTYKDIAIEEMKRTGVPASITLAQALLESDDGNSRLAREANNHFAIKCHKNWDGKSIHHDDDKKNECFRKYKSVRESYIDHSDFLRSAKRYEFLFELSPTDYRGWAKGLKTAGYATDKLYDEKLIKIIEDNRLYEYDIGKQQKKTEKEAERTIEHEILKVNRRNYIIAKKEDTFEKLAMEFDKTPRQLIKYNDLPKNVMVTEGQIVFIQPKRNRAARGNEFHTVQQGETMYTISQKYAVKLEKLYKINEMKHGTPLNTGDLIYLRKKQTKPPAPTKPDVENDEKVKIIFEE